VVEENIRFEVILLNGLNIRTRSNLKRIPWKPTDSHFATYPPEERFNGKVKVPIQSPLISPYPTEHKTGDSTETTLSYKQFYRLFSGVFG